MTNLDHDVGLHEDDLDDDWDSHFGLDAVSIGAWRMKGPTQFPQFKPISRSGDQKKIFSNDVLISLRMTYATHELKTIIDITPKKAGGAPVLKGTRFKAAQVLAELAQGHSVAYLEREYGLDRKLVIRFLDSLAVLLDRPFR